MICLSSFHCMHDTVHPVSLQILEATIRSLEPSVLIISLNLKLTKTWTDSWWVRGPVLLTLQFERDRVQYWSLYHSVLSTDKGRTIRPKSCAVSASLTVLWKRYTYCLKTLSGMAEGAGEWVINSSEQPMGTGSSSEARGLGCPRSYGVIITSS